ncbi:IS1096 element passenger TnpR family protein [Georgenia sp. Z1344]|uniref:IS1096 element passenger TnpR family protein n=1 Tax=Georgenia sp. Z1344 TaxID=3416706 RepID=UPI003CF77594
MARTWLTVTVELLGGRWEELWPQPGRVFAVGPSHTFEALADAINDAFGRWDLAHLSVFTLEDGRVVSDPETVDEAVSSMAGPLVGGLDSGATKVAKVVGTGDEMRFEFDLGDGWVHRCVVGVKVDPDEVLGLRPKRPVAFRGWGTLPDQHGRRWWGDDGEGRVPRRPPQADPMLAGEWPPADRAPGLDLREVRAAVAARDAQWFLDAVLGRDVDDALQQVGAGLPWALVDDRGAVEGLALAIVNRLGVRDFEGDRVLADDLLALLRQEPLGDRLLPVDLATLAEVMHEDPESSEAGYVDLETGAVFHAFEADDGVVGDDVAIDVESDPDRYLEVEPVEKRAAWQDMAAFAEAQAGREGGSEVQDRLERAIDGSGAFRRFRDLIEKEGLVERWMAFSEDRRIGRARAVLADEGIRVGEPVRD